jgi:uncharacterized membrane protein
MSTTIVIVSVALAALVVGVIVGMFLWAIKTSPTEAQMLRVAREPRIFPQPRPRTRVTTRAALDS